MAPGDHSDAPGRAERDWLDSGFPPWRERGPCLREPCAVARRRKEDPCGRHRYGNCTGNTSHRPSPEARRDPGAGPHLRQPLHELQHPLRGSTALLPQVQQRRPVQRGTLQHAGRDLRLVDYSPGHARLVEAPYIAAVVDLPRGISLVDADVSSASTRTPRTYEFRHGKVQMYTEKVSEDKEGNSYVAYKFRPAE
ncbi:MAG: hypothetical protein U5Q44_08470 [Dehalococcoidia bacterium]|nr:hypothetical protein [Dehalococcoidia bacterium]